MASRKNKRQKMGFKQALEYVLDELCFAYYVKHDNLVSDQTFDELEKLYMGIFKQTSAPMRAEERRESYTTGVQVVYECIKESKIDSK